MSHRSYRPVTVFSFRLDALRGHSVDAQGRIRASPYSFHETNVVLHAVASALVGVLALRMLPGDAIVPSCVAAVLFAVHTIHTEAVAGLVGRADILAAIFFILAIIAHQYSIKHRKVSTKFEGSVENSKDLTDSIISENSKIPNTPVQSKKSKTSKISKAPKSYNKSKDFINAKGTKDSDDFDDYEDLKKSYKFMRLVNSEALILLTIILAVLGTLSKESGITVLGYCVFVEMLEWAGALSIVRSSLMVVSAAIFMRARLALHNGRGLYPWTVMENHIALEEDLWTKIFSYANTHGMYAWMLLVPTGLCYNHGLGTLPVVSSPTLISIVAYSALVALCLLALVRRDGLLARLLAMALLPFVPASNLFFPIGATLAERLLYIPSIGACILVGLLVQRCESWPRLHRILLACLAVYTIVLSVWTVERNEDWISDMTLFESGYREEPDNVGILNNIGYMYMQDNSNSTRLHMARNFFQKATETYPNFTSAYANWAIVAGKLSYFEEAVNTSREAVRTNPHSCDLQTRLAETLISLIEHEVALPAGDHPLAQEVQSVLYNKSTQCPAKPLRQYMMAKFQIVRYGPHYADMELFEMALETNKKIQEGSPDRLNEDTVLDFMAQTAKDRGDLTKALQYWERAISLPGGASIAVLTNAAVSGWVRAHEVFLHGEVTYKLNDGTTLSCLQRAGQLLSDALTKEQNNAGVHANIGWFYEVSKEYDLALKSYSHSLSLFGGKHSKVESNIARVQATIENISRTGVADSVS